MTPCPKCQSKLITYWRVQDNEIVCQCPNPSCPMYRLEGTGQSTEQAIASFEWECDVQAKQQFQGKAVSR